MRASRDPGGELGLQEALVQQALDHACAAHPSECCGYLGSSTVRRLTTSGQRHSFVVDRVTELAALDREVAAAAAEGRRVVLYHSHPGGRASWSRADDQIWTTPLGPSWDVDHLVIAVDRKVVAEAGPRAGTEAANEAGTTGDAATVLGAVLVRWQGGRFVEVGRWPRRVS